MAEPTLICAVLVIPPTVALPLVQDAAPEIVMAEKASGYVAREIAWKDEDPSHRFDRCANPAGCGQPGNLLSYDYTIIGTGSLLWDYAQAVPVVQDGALKTVIDDHINHFDLFGGLGSSLARLRHLQLGAEATGGVRLYGWHTYQGFKNTELPTTGFARLWFTLEYRP